MRLWVKITISLLLGCCALRAQATFRALNGISSGGSGSVSISNHGSINSSSCANGSTSCLISTTVGTTGDAVWTVIGACMNTSCTSVSGCSVSLSDGVNTYSTISAANIANVTEGSISYYVWNYLAKNATSGTRNLTTTISGSGCSFNYVSQSYADLAGANASNPIDGNLSATFTGSSCGSTCSITSSADPSEANEVVLAAAIQNGSTWSGAGTGFSTLDQPQTSWWTIDASNPSTSSTVTAAPATNSGVSALFMTMVGIKW